VTLKADLWAIAVLVALAAFVTWQALRLGDLAVDRQRLEAAAEASARSQRAAAELEYTRPVQVMQEFLERPLFWQDRRPLEIVEEEPPEPPPPPPRPPPPPPRGLTVTGVVKLGDEWRVLIRRERPPETVRLAPGEEIDGWTVQAIAPHHVTLGYGNASVELPLYDPPVAPAAVARPAAAKRPAGSAGASKPVQSGKKEAARDDK
jgi:hypothetical protein